MVTSRAIVPCSAALGLVPPTVGFWATTREGVASRSRSTAKHRKEPFAQNRICPSIEVALSCHNTRHTTQNVCRLLTRTLQFLFRGNSTHFSHQHKWRPEIRMAEPAAGAQNAALGQRQRFRLAALLQMAVEAAHQLECGAVVDLPQAGQNRWASGKKEGACEPDKIVSRGNLCEISAAQSGIAGAQCNQLGVQSQAQDLVDLQ